MTNPGNTTDLRGMLAIFDCDGVLVDTEEINRRALITVLRRFGIDMTEAQATEHFHGLSNTGIVEKAEATWGIQLGTPFVLDLELAESDLVRRHVRPIEGVLGAVTDIINMGIATCVASNGTLRGIRERLSYAGLRELFAERLFSAEQVARGKPFPDVFAHAARSMGYRPDSCVVVEDSVAGVAAGVSAGMRVLAFAPHSRRASEPALRAAGGEVFNEMGRLPGLIVESR